MSEHDRNNICKCGHCEAAHEAGAQCGEEDCRCEKYENLVVYRCLDRHDLLNLFIGIPDNNNPLFVRHLLQKTNEQLWNYYEVRKAKLMNDLKKTKDQRENRIIVPGRTCNAKTTP